MLFNFKLFAIKNISLHLEAEKGGLFYLVFSYHKEKNASKRKEVYGGEV